MTDTRKQFNPDYHTVPDKLRAEPLMRHLARWRRALHTCLEPMATTHFDGDAQAVALLAQKLAFVPPLERGWQPTEEMVQRAAPSIVAGYFAHYEVFASEGFPDPGQAALEAMKNFTFRV